MSPTAIARGLCGRAVISGSYISMPPGDEFDIFLCNFRRPEAMRIDYAIIDPALFEVVPEVRVQNIIITRERALEIRGRNCFRFNRRPAHGEVKRFRMPADALEGDVGIDIFVAVFRVLRDEEYDNHYVRRTLVGKFVVYLRTPEVLEQTCIMQRSGKAWVYPDVASLTEVDKEKTPTKRSRAEFEKGTAGSSSNRTPARRQINGRSFVN